MTIDRVITFGYLAHMNRKNQSIETIKREGYGPVYCKGMQQVLKLFGLSLRSVAWVPPIGPSLISGGMYEQP